MSNTEATAVETVKCGACGATVRKDRTYMRTNERCTARLCGFTCERVFTGEITRAEAELEAVSYLETLERGSVALGDYRDAYTCAKLVTEVRNGGERNTLGRLSALARRIESGNCDDRTKVAAMLDVHRHALAVLWGIL